MIYLSTSREEYKDGTRKEKENAGFASFFASGGNEENDRVFGVGFNR